MTDSVEQSGSEPSKPAGIAGTGQGTGSNWNIDLLLDVELPVSVSFGNSEMQLRDVLKLGAGSVIELDKSVNDPVTMSTLVGRGVDGIITDHPALARKVLRERAELSSVERLLITLAGRLGIPPKIAEQ